MALFPALLAHPMTVPAGLVALSVSLLLKKKAETAALALAQGPASEPPVFDADARAEILTTTAERGQAVQSFKTDVAALLVRALGKCSVESEPLEGPEATKRMLFKVGPPAGDLSAAQAALTAQANGLVVLGSLSLALLGNAEVPCEKFLLFVRPEERTLASAQGQFAVLLDAYAAAVVAGVAETQSVASVDFGKKTITTVDLDEHLPPNIQAMIRTNLEKAAPDFGEMAQAAMAFDAGGMPKAAKAIRDRLGELSAAAEARAAMASAQNVSATPVASEPVAVAPVVVDTVGEAVGTAPAEPSAEAPKKSREKRAAKRAAKLAVKSAAAAPAPAQGEEAPAKTNGSSHKPLLAIVQDPAPSAPSAEA